MKRWIHATTDIKLAESVFKDIVDYIKSDGMGYSDSTTWAARITESGYIEYITFSDVKEAVTEDPEYCRQDPLGVLFDCGHLITNKKGCTDFAKKYGFLEDYAAY